jgi:DNA-binding response OmpR family regulator
MGHAARNSPVSALLAGAFGDDRLFVQDVFRQSGWRLFEASDRQRATRCLRRHRVQVVIACSETPGWSWQELLERLDALPDPPLLIVTSHAANEHLWAEVINIGGFDVLSQPFEREELVRAVDSACRHFLCRPARADRSQPLLTAVPYSF